MEETTKVLYELLDRQEIDFALCVTNRLPEEPSHCLLLRKSYLKLFVRQDHPPGPERLHRPYRAEGHPPGHVLRPLRPDSLYPPHVHPERGPSLILHQTTQVFTILEYIRSEGAAGFLTEEIAQQEPDLHPISVRQFRPAYITLDWNKDLHFNPAMEEFVRFVKKACRFDAAGLFMECLIPRWSS